MNYSYTALHKKSSKSIAMRKLLKIQGIALRICKPRSPTVINWVSGGTLQNGHDSSLGVHHRNKVGRTDVAWGGFLLSWVALERPWLGHHLRRSEEHTSGLQS